METGYVYFVGGPLGPVKIGFTTKPLDRLDYLRTSSPSPLEILGLLAGVTRDHERFLHEKLESDRLHGEWFDRSPAVLDEIRKAIDKPPAASPPSLPRVRKPKTIKGAADVETIHALTQKVSLLEARLREKEETERKTKEAMDALVRALRFEWSRERADRSGIAEAQHHAGQILARWPK